MVQLKNVIVITLMVMACLVSLTVLGFCCYKLAKDSEPLYVSLLSTILGMWLGIAASYIKKVTGTEAADIEFAPVASVSARR